MHKKFWTNEEDTILYENTGGKKNLKELEKMLPNRTRNAIKARCKTLGLRISSGKNKGITKKEGYGKKYSLVRNYEKSFGIVLDFEKDVYTYSPIQWWKWTYSERTPNGRLLNRIPMEMYRDEDKLFEIIRYVLKHEANLITREDLLTVSISLLKGYRIYFEDLFTIGWHEVMKKVYPNHSFKTFEFSNVPLGYWKNKDNCDEYFKYVLDEYININSLDDIRIDLPPLLSINNLRAMRLNGIINGIFKYRHYPSVCEWVITLYPNLNFTHNDFKEFVGFDGEKLSSSGEVIVYNLLKRDLNLKVTTTKRYKNFKFHNQSKNETYVPDFILELNNRKVIVEYFGLYREKHYGDKMLESYYYKTLDKIEYFSNLPDVEFIYIMPKDIHNLTKLKEKILDELNSFALKEVS